MEPQNSPESIVDQRRPPLVAAIIPILFLIALLGINVYFYADYATSGFNQIALLLAAGMAGLIGWCLKVPFSKMLDGVTTSLGSALGAILILLMIGALSGTWLISGVVPAMIYYGLEILNPQFFLVACTLICAVVSIATGSSWSTVATVGIALMGIGSALNVNPAMTAGAIISGAYFGDKLSPLSDTTNLAAAMAGTDLFTHIRYMLWTTVPSILIALGLFAYLGLSVETGATTERADAMSAAIAESFNITPLLFIVPVAVLAMVLMKVDALVALFLGTLLGGLFALIFQPDVVAAMAEKSRALLAEEELGGANIRGGYVGEAYVAIVNSMAIETKFDNDNADVAKLLKSKGMAGMLNTVWLIVTAMCFGGVMEACGLLKRITDPLVEFAKSTGSLVATTAASCLFLNFTASDQYLAIVVPGRMFRETYRERGLAPQNLSRTLEDSGTVTSVLVPWNTCGAVQATVLGIGTLTYLPYCFFNLISPLMTIFVAYAGIRIAKLSKAAAKPGL